jgi:hypothetical protein
MTISVNVRALRRTRWYEYVIRFFFGGLATMAAGLIAQRYGPAIGGVFLAFPGILPASATLVEKHETRKKKRAGPRRCCPWKGSGRTRCSRRHSRQYRTSWLRPSRLAGVAIVHPCVRARCCNPCMARSVRTRLENPQSALTAGVLASEGPGVCRGRLAACSATSFLKQWAGRRGVTDSRDTIVLVRRRCDLGAGRASLFLGREIWNLAGGLRTYSGSMKCGTSEWDPFH